MVILIGSNFHHRGSLLSTTTETTVLIAFSQSILLKLTAECNFAAPSHAP